MESGIESIVKDICSDNIAGRNLEPEASVLRGLLHPRSVCLHVGASTGRHTYVMSTAAPNGQIYAFEPSRDTFPVLQAVVARHGLGNVSCYNLAVSDESGEVELSVPVKIGGQPGHSFGYMRLDNTRRRSDLRFVDEITYRVKATTLDDFVEDMGLEQVDWVRIDAEGGEARILPGAKRVFERFRPNALIEFHPHVLRDLFDTQVQALLDPFLTQGYQCFYLQEGKFVRTELVIDELFRDYFLMHPDNGSLPA